MNNTTVNLSDDIQLQRYCLANKTQTPQTKIKIATKIETMLKGHIYIGA